MDNFLYLAETEINSAIVVLNIIFVLTMELIIAWTYKKTHRTLSYSQSFIFTIVLMGLIASVIMMVVAQNIVGAFALLGAFSLIRFRTIVKETRDIAFVFFALAIGVAGGTNNYTVALISTLLISLIIIALDKFNFGTAIQGKHILTIIARQFFDPESEQSSWHKYLRARNILHIRTMPDNLNEFTYGISLRKPGDEASLVNELTRDDKVESVELTSGKDTVEY